ncbi:MAG TPA: imelysin family protein [Flavipsychrobacter sp.]|nr:imelysin family protein [Flavipsychrobacter sp.]
MKKQSIKLLTLGAIAASALYLGSCNNDDDNPQPAVSFAELEGQVLSSFNTTVGTPLYNDFKTKAEALNQAVITLAATPTAANQVAAQNAWKAVRIVWEQSEGFLIGPVDDNNYDPYMDTWPTDRNELDALLASTQPLDAAALGGFTNEETQLTLRGFHPLEYLLWKDNVSYTAREKEYMQGLAQDVLNNVNKLVTDWAPYSTELVNAGKPGSRYTSKKDALLTLSGAFVGICGEVGEGKMLEPFEGPNAGQPDSTITESPYSHNSIADFKNNIQGAYNVYLCKYGGSTGKSLSDLVAYNNKTLDQNIKTKFEAAIASFDGITTTFEQAIYTQRTAVQNTLDAIGSLKTTVDGPLNDYINQYVKD